MKPNLRHTVAPLITRVPQVQYAIVSAALFNSAPPLYHLLNRLLNTSVGQADKISRQCEVVGVLITIEHVANAIGREMNDCVAFADKMERYQHNAIAVRDTCTKFIS